MTLTGNAHWSNLIFGFEMVNWYNANISDSEKFPNQKHTFFFFFSPPQNRKGFWSAFQIRDTQHILVVFDPSLLPASCLGQYLLIIFLWKKGILPSSSSHLFLHICPPSIFPLKFSHWESMCRGV